jgi:hypothetical protein
MATLVLIQGESGTGKSASIERLSPKETFLISAISKPLPFRGGNKKYISISKENPLGNYKLTDNHEMIRALLTGIGKERKDIKHIVIDDFQYVIVNEFMRRHGVVGVGNAVFQLYNDLADHAWNIIMDAQLCREDIIVFFLSHTETDENGKTRFKTIGRLLTEKITVEGLFSIVIETKVVDGVYTFVTQNNGRNTAKSPKGMFLSNEIPNDLNAVAKAINGYNS